MTTLSWVTVTVWLLKMPPPLLTRVPETVIVPPGRTGSGVAVGDGLVLTVAHLVVRADDIRVSRRSDCANGTGYGLEDYKVFLIQYLTGFGVGNEQPGFWEVRFSSELHRQARDLAYASQRLLARFSPNCVFPSHISRSLFGA